MHVRVSDGTLEGVTVKDHFTKSPDGVPQVCFVLNDRLGLATQKMPDMVHPDHTFNLVSTPNAPVGLPFLRLHELDREVFYDSEPTSFQWPKDDIEHIRNPDGSETVRNSDGSIIFSFDWFPFKRLEIQLDECKYVYNPSDIDYEIPNRHANTQRIIAAIRIPDVPGSLAHRLSVESRDRAANASRHSNCMSSLCRWLGAPSSAKDKIAKDTRKDSAEGPSPLKSSSGWWLDVTWRPDATSKLFLSGKIRACEVPSRAEVNASVEKECSYGVLKHYDGRSRVLHLYWVLHDPLNLLVDGPGPHVQNSRQPELDLIYESGGEQAPLLHEISSKGKQAVRYGSGSGGAYGSTAHADTGEGSSRMLGAISNSGEGSSRINS